jgi:uncharacterized MAPEG superfamily protein
LEKARAAAGITRRSKVERAAFKRPVRYPETGAIEAAMTQELTALVLAVLLGFAHLFIAANAATAIRGIKWNAGPRDGQKQPLHGLPGRLDRAFRNYLETFAFFAAAVLIAHLANRHNALTVFGAWLYVIARVIYFPLYAAGIAYIRSLVWLLATAGIFMILAGLYWP